MTRNTKFAVAAFLILASGVVYWGTGQFNENRPALGERASAAAPQPTYRRQDVPSASGPAHPAIPISTVNVLSKVDVAKATRPLPPLNTTLTLIYSDLQDLAQNGNKAAACRLAYELARCRRLPELERRLANYTRQAESSLVGSPVRDDALWGAGVIKAEIEGGRMACPGFPAQETQNAWRYEFAAAQAGHEASIIRFATGATLDSYNFLADVEGWVAHRAYGPSLLQQAADIGNPQAYLQLGFLTARPVWGVQQLPKDPISTVAYWTALTRVATPEYRNRLQAEIQGVIQRNNLSAADLAQASAKADRLTARLNQRGASGVDFSRGLLGPDDAGKHCSD
jgi:hypothetical protein